VSSFRSALVALNGANVPYQLRKVPDPAVLPLDGELDLLVRRQDVPRLSRALRSAGFHRLRAPGNRPHRFFVAFWEGRWYKVDAKLVSARQERRDPANRAKRFASHGIPSRLAKRMPASPRRLGPVIAVLGPDGAGKGTLLARLKDETPFGVTVIYLGRRTRSSDQREDEDSRPGPLRECVFLLWKAIRSWGVLSTGYAAAWRGHVVLCDRHPIEVLAIRPRRTALGTKLERILVNRLTPHPDAIVVLDAPADVLHARKAEHPIETLQAWRAGYREVFEPQGATILSTTSPLDETVPHLSAVVWEELRIRRRW